MHERTNQASTGLVVAGYLTGVLIPIVGFFVGLALVLKARAGHGVAVMVVSVMTAMLVAVVALGGGESAAGGPVPVPTLTQEQMDRQAGEDRRKTEASSNAYYRCLDRMERQGVVYVDALDRCIK